MITCKSCGVELEKSMNFCPLCGKPVKDHTSHPELILIRKGRPNVTHKTDYERLTATEKRKFFWTISLIILLSGILMTFIIDYLGNSSLSWSKYSILICAVILANTTLISFLNKNLILLLLGSFISTSALLVILDMYDGNMVWGLQLGIPLLFAAYVIVYILIILIKSAGKKGLNIIAYSFIVCGLLSICAEGLISLYIKNNFHIEWSLIVNASVLPVAALLLYIHYKLKKGTDLKRFFHI